MISSHKDGRTNWPQRIKEVSIRTINECLLYKNNYLLPLASTWCTTSLLVTCSPDILVKVVVKARRSEVYTETLLLFTSHVRLWANSKCQHIAQYYQRSRKTIQSNFGESILLAVTWPHVHPFMTKCTAANQNEIRRKCFYVNVLVTGRKNVLLNELMQCLGCYQTHSTHIYLWYIMSLGSLTSCLVTECVKAHCLLKDSLRYNVYIAFRNWSRLITFARGTKLNENNCGFSNLSFSFAWVETPRVRSRPKVSSVCSCSFEGIWIVRRYTLETSTCHRVSAQMIHPRNVLSDKSCLLSLLRAWTLKRLYISFWFT